jgi:hypothetical protein
MKTRHHLATGTLFQGNGMGVHGDILRGINKTVDKENRYKPGPTHMKRYKGEHDGDAKTAD